MKLLVVDDEQILRIGTAWTLRECGFEVDEAEDGFRALSLLEKNTYAIIFMDLSMPNMGGFECTTKIRNKERESQSSQPRHRNVIVALSSSVAPDIKTHCLKAGMDAYLSKSCTKDELKAVVKRYIGSSIIGSRPMTDVPKL